MPGSCRAGACKRLIVSIPAAPPSPPPPAEDALPPLSPPRACAACRSIRLRRGSAVRSFPLPARCAVAAARRTRGGDGRVERACGGRLVEAVGMIDSKMTKDARGGRQVVLATSSCVRPHQMDTADPWFECLLLRARRTRGRRARVPASSPCCAGGARGVFGGLRSLVRGSGTLVCKATIGRVRGWCGSTKNLYLVSHPPAQPRRSHHKLSAWIYPPPAQQGDADGTLARLPLVLRARNKRHSNQGSAVSI